MAMLIASIAADTVDAMIAMALRALETEADMVELRLDALRSGQAAVAELGRRLPAGRWLATCRPVSQGGMSRDPVEHRATQLASALEAGAVYVDFEHADWKRSAVARDILLRRLSGNGSERLILSHHDLDRKPAQLEQLVGEMSHAQAVPVKIAWPATSIMDNFDAFKLMQGGRGSVTAICMGEAGAPSRILAPKFGAFAGYCAPDAVSATAPGQFSLDEMLNRFRWASIGDATAVYGVIGDPVAHSLGTDLFNDVFSRQLVDGVYLPLLVNGDYQSLASFLDACLKQDWLDARGFSVTLPHKINALRYLGDRAEPPADVIGAVNTIRIEDGEIWGCNTDCDAAMDALLAGIGCGEAELDGVPVDVLGAGGAARAVVAGLTGCGCRVTVFNRDARRANELADAFECRIRPWEERADCDGGILINCTSVGMHPDVESTPMPAGAMRAECVVFDMVYRPRRTQLLRDAEAAGCRTIEGVDMFVRQAAMQFEFWTQQQADIERMAAVVAARLDESTV